MSNPISSMHAISTHRLWAMILHSTSLNWPTSDLLRSESPNLEAKRLGLRKHSKLQLNSLLAEEDHWDDDRIVERGRWLAAQLDSAWPSPTSPIWDTLP